MAWKLRRKSTPTDRERIKTLEDQMADTTSRLDAAVAESQRLSKAMDELQTRDHMADLRKKLKRKFGPARPSDMMVFDPDDTVN